MAFHKILVPLDATDLADRALQIALSLAGAFDAELILLSVRSEAPSLDQGETEDDMDAIEREGQALVEMARNKLPGTGASEDRIRTEIRSGSPAEAIVQAAQDLMADLIVMGTHGRVGLRKKLTGSITEKVQARTSASVLAVKPLGFPYLRE